MRIGILIALGFSLAAIKVARAQPAGSTVSTPRQSYYLTSFDGSAETFRALTSSDELNYTDLPVSFPSPSGTVRDPGPIMRDNKYVVAYTLASISTIGKQITAIGINTSSDGRNYINVASPDFGAALPALFTLWCAGWYQEGDTDYLLLAGSTHYPFDDDGFQAYLTSPVMPGDYTSWNRAIKLTVIGEANFLASNIVKVGTNYFLWYKTETPDASGNVYIQVAESTTGIIGPYTNIHTGDWMGIGTGHEGSFTGLARDGKTWILNTDAFASTGLCRTRQIAGDWTTGGPTKWSTCSRLTSGGVQLRNGGWMIPTNSPR